MAPIARLALLALALFASACVQPAADPSAPHSSKASSVHESLPSVVLVSLDGFRWDQLEFEEATTLRELAAHGVRAEGLIPVFPSKTFPNHYSIVTGLYPKNHGIVSNNMRSESLGEFRLSDRAALARPEWWGGEPIWVTAKKAGLPTAAMFWPGTETEIKGLRPDHWFPFDSEKPFAERVDQVLDWLSLPSEVRPRLITLYFEQPDSSNHRFGPSSQQAHEAIAEVDSQLRRLVDGITRLGLDDRVNLVITSDHGMAEVHSDRIIPIDDLAAFEPGELFESGAFVQIFPREDRRELLYRQLVDAHPRLSVYRREEIPPELHLRGAERVAPLIAVPDVGWEAMTAQRRLRLEEGALGGHHGPDPTDQRMHGLFVASGPSIRRGVVLPRFQNVHIYEFLTRILDLAPAPNDGDAEVLAGALETSTRAMR